MAQIDFKYLILDCDEVVFESTAQAKISQKDLKETEKFVKEHNYSPEFADIPGKVYEKCMDKAYEKASTEYPEINERYEEVEVALEQYIPVCLIEQLSEEVKNKMLSDEPYYLSESDLAFSHDDIDRNIIESGTDACGKKSEANSKAISGNESPTDSQTDINQPEAQKGGLVEVKEGSCITESIEPSKENTLYLPIKQIYFDEIIEGSKKKEFREIKPTTYKKYLKCDLKGNPFVDTSLIDMEDPLCDDINVWNNGVFPLLPNDKHKYLHLAVGYNKERDEALVEIVNTSFEPLLDEEGNTFRFDEENGKAFRCENGRLCFWNIVYHLGKILKVQRIEKEKSNKRTQPKKVDKSNNNLKTLTLQINRESFETILNGTQKVEHRFIYPSNQSRYVRYICEGKEYKNLYDTPDNDSPIETIPVKYDALYLINGRRKDAPRLTVEVTDAEVVRIVDEEGKEITYEENGLVYSQCQIWYYLGKIISTENIK